MGILKNLEITNHYKYMLYLAGILLILSFSIEVKAIPNINLSILSLITIFYGIIGWLYNMNFKNRANNINIEWQFVVSSGDKKREEDFLKKYSSIKLFKNYEHTTLILLVIFIIIFLSTIIFMF